MWLLYGFAAANSFVTVKALLPTRTNDEALDYVSHIPIGVLRWYLLLYTAIFAIFYLSSSDSVHLPFFSYVGISLAILGAVTAMQLERRLEQDSGNKLRFKRSLSRMTWLDVVSAILSLAYSLAFIVISALGW